MKIRTLMSAVAAIAVTASIATAGLWNFPSATSTGTSRSAATLPMTGSECIPGDTNLSGGRAPQTACYTQGNLKGNYITTITSAPTTVAWSVADNAQLYRLNLGGSGNTLSNPTGLTTGQTVKLLVMQSAAGSESLTWGTYFVWPAKTGGAVTAPTLSTTASTGDLFTFTYDGTSLLSDKNQTTGQGLVP